MNIQEYISSGILEAYVLGTLTQEENEQVDKMIASYPELKEELDAIEKAMYQYALSHSKTPPANLKQQLFDKIDEKEGRQIHLPTKKKSVSYYLVAASVVAIFSFGCAVYFWSKWRQAEQQILAMEQQNSKIAQNLNLVNNKLQTEVQSREVYIASLRSDLKVALDTTTHIIQLKGLPNSTEALAVVLWNKNSHDVYIDVKNLPSPPADKQYQLWALLDGQPIDAGVFEVSDSLNLQHVKNVASAQAFAVTLEKKGGSPTPTLEAMYLLGKL